MLAISHYQRATGRQPIYLSDLTIVVPAYEQPLMLEKQLQTWSLHSDETLDRLTFIIVDDCSPTPLEPAVRKAGNSVLERVRLYRMSEDVKWNRNICRNAAAEVAETEWLMNVDVDHVLPPLCADKLFQTKVDPECWYRFARMRVGAADDTRRKDQIPDSCEFGAIKPHIDSHLMTRELFMRSPYDPDYTGCLGGGSPFLARMQQIASVHVLPPEVHLYVYTRHVIADASIFTLDRDTSKFKALRKKKEAAGNTEPKNLFQHKWERVL